MNMIAAPGPYGRAFLQVKAPYWITIIPHAPGTKNQSRTLWTFSLPGMAASVNGKNRADRGEWPHPPLGLVAAGW
mgnify:CR=1 FL=1